MAAPAAPPSVELFSTRLADDKIDTRQKFMIASELKDQLEVLHQHDYSNTLAKLMPVFYQLLRGPPSFLSTSNEHKLRNCILDIIHRLPFSPQNALEVHAVELMKVMMALVRIENEENAVLCMKIIMDFQRNYQKTLSDQVQPYLDLIQEMFAKMPQAVKDTFDTPAYGGATPMPSTPANVMQSPKPGSPMMGGDDTPANKNLVKGMQSFKVLAECPIIVVSLFQAHKQLVPDNIKLFVPLIREMIMLQAAPQAEAHKLAAQNGQVLSGPCANIRNKAAFGDFVTAQVKTMSFLAYVLRGYSKELADFLTKLPDVVVRLLKDCPREKSSARKELLVATRHIINFNFRKVFLTKIDELLDERVLIGDGLTVYETMRPLAYSMLADLIHHVRESLNSSQIRRTVIVYTKNLHDTFPGTSFQTMSAKLLMNLAECIAKQIPDKQEARHFLLMILDAIADKFAAMNRQYENAVKHSKPHTGAEDDAMDIDRPEQEEYDEIDIFQVTPIKLSNRDRGQKPVDDNKFLFKNLMNGLKNMLSALRACNPPLSFGDPANNPPNWSEVAYGFNAEEVKIITKLFREGAYVFRYYHSETDKTNEQTFSTPLEFMQSILVPSNKEEKDLLETFATVFHCIDPATFHEVFHSEIPRLYEMMFEHYPLLHIPQFFLASEATSPAFCGMLLQFLMSKMEEVGTKDVMKASILLRLFKLSFMAVTLFSQHNEPVLLPHVSKIITQAIQLSTTAEEPVNYFYLLRSLFRSIGGGRFEVLYKEILPLLEVLLQVLNTKLHSARDTKERDLYVELCLTVPARLSNLLPHLSYLMRPLVVALSAGLDLVTQGLRTLELCVDNLTADYLDPIMAPVIDDLMTALWNHLKPLPYSHQQSHTTMRILGKLGGRNRKFLTHPPTLEYRTYSDDECSVNLKLHGAPGERPYPFMVAMDLAIRTLKDSKANIFHRREAFKLLSSSLKLFIGQDNLPDDFMQVVRTHANDLVNDSVDVPNPQDIASDRDKPVHKKHEQDEQLRALIKACLYATSIDELKDEATELLADICRHLAVLDIGNAVTAYRYSKQPFSVEGGEGPLTLDTNVLADALSDCLGSEVPAVREAAMEGIRVTAEAGAVIFGNPTYIGKLPLFSAMSKRFCHNCYAEEWYSKAGGCLGIKALLTKVSLGEMFLVDRQLDWVRSLLYIIKDMPQDLPATTREDASTTLHLVLNECNKGAQKDDIKPGSKLFNLCTHIVYELSNCNKHVRQAAQQSLETLSKLLKVDIAEMIAPVKDRLVGPIFGKPLRALPFASQIGYIDAITFCLKLQNNFLEIDHEMMRLLGEALALADADDETLGTQKANEYRTMEAVMNLRVGCIRLLSMAIAYPEFNTSTQQQTKGRIIAVFFKSLYAKSPEVVEAANDGLKGVLTHTHKLPKELLQNGLRPILMNLSDHKRLSVAGLEGLARLLELLTNYFKVEIGSRLFDHLNQFADPNTIHQTSFKLLEQNSNIKIIASILNIFHLLPPAASQFLDKMVQTVLTLEEGLRRTQVSPFRPPLLKFVNRYAEETWKYMLARLQSMRFSRLFSQLLEDESSVPLREHLITHVGDLVKASFDSDLAGEAKTTAIFGAIEAIGAVCKHKSYWLVEHKDLLNKLLTVGSDVYMKAVNGDLKPPSLCLSVDQSATTLISIFVKYLEQRPNDLAFLFQCIKATSSGTLKPNYLLDHFIYERIICSHSIEYWKSVIFKCLDLYQDTSQNQMLKTYAFKNLVNPILLMDIQRRGQDDTGPRLVDGQLVSAVHHKIWKTNLGELDDGQNGLDRSRMEVLQMSALLIKHHHAIIADARKDVIKFGWNFIKLEDIINKQAAYVLIAFFIAHFETPSKIVTQIYVALLKAHQPEGRTLVKQALDLIAPVLPKRIPPGADSKGFPIWAKWPRRILVEESHNQPQLINIFQFIVRHGDLFYESRENFYMGMVSALQKLVFHVQNPSAEHKILSIDMVELIWKWEQQAIDSLADVTMMDSPQMKKRKLPDEMGRSSPSASSAASGPPGSSSGDKVPVLQPQYRQSVLKHLITFISTCPEKWNANELCERSVKLLENLLQPKYWGDVDVDLYQKQAEVQLMQAELKNDNAHSFVNMLQVLKVIVQAKPNEWLLGSDRAGRERITTLQKILEKSLKCDNVDIQEALQDVVLRILEVIPQEQEDDEDEEMTESTGSQFVKLLTQIVNETVSVSVIPSINILWILAKKRPDAVDTHVSALMRAFQRLARDHIAGGTPAAPQQPAADAQPPPPPLDPDVALKLISNVIDIAAARISSLQDQRRPFLSVLAQLVEKSPNNELCLKILGVVENWVFHSTESFPTLKEKTAVLSKMMSFEGRPDPTLCNKFLELVISIYEHPEITRTELTVRLEHAFLIGCRAQDVKMRNRFLKIFTESLSRTINPRILYLLGTQNWETLQDSYWLSQVTQLLFGCIDKERRLELHAEDFKLPAASTMFAMDKKKDMSGLMLDEQYEDFMARHRRFVASLGDVKSVDIFEPLAQLQHLSADIAHEIWVMLFPLCWAAIGHEDRGELSRNLINLLTKECHHRQMDKRPNVIQSLLAGIERANPRIVLPPHLIKYISKSFNAWYSALHILEDSAYKPPYENPTIKESNLDALAEIYAGIQEEDMFYGLWRRRCQYLETNVALSFEQNGMWDKAQHAYEQAQIKARTGVLPFSQAEYMLWEDHWILCAQKLQQWEILSDFAKHENYNDLLLECAWRLLDDWGGQSSEAVDTTIKSLMDSPTPRRYFFLAFMALQKVHSKNESNSDFLRICDEAIQLSLRKWHNLPKKITAAHIPLLQTFQQIVELHDASVMYSSLANTTASNLDLKSQELKQNLGTWRDRLPNTWDDINAWHDLVTWRQHVFTSINKTYLPLVPQTANNNNSNSYAYRGYHETAWIINRFAHVARKHQLADVCIAQLSKIYTLPNIEIQEAFLKLREQAKCHYQNPAELNNGLEVINNTNLNYFVGQQKAEFYTLKGMFQAKLGKKDEANEAFGTALFYDLKLPKAWAEWGFFNDTVFKDNPTDLALAGNAVSCYLEAAGLYKSGKARKLLSRVLWHLSLDDSTGVVSAAFDAYKGEMPVWYWITYIPQLLSSLSHKEAKIAKSILLKIAKNFPQALYFLLRTSREDYSVIKKQQSAQQAKAKANQPNQGSPPTAAPGSAVSPPRPDSSTGARPETPSQPNGVVNSGNASSPAPASPAAPKRNPWEHADEIMSVLKSAFPLLALSMETMGDQIHKYFKCPPDEDAYRLIVALLNDGLQFVGRIPLASPEDTKLPPATEANITRFAETILPAHIRVAFEEEFVHEKPNLQSYIQKLRRWRDRFEEKLDRRPAHASLESFSPHLSDFRFQKFEEVEVPGQYLLHRDHNKDFVRIERFLPRVDVVRGYGICHRRLKMRGHDGSVHAFAVQHPAQRHCRREERVAQLFRIFNGILSKRKEARRRNLGFHLPLMVPLAPHIRIVQDDASYISLQGIYEDYCRKTGISKDDPLIYAMKSLRNNVSKKMSGPEVQNLKMEVLSAIQEKMVPSNVVQDYMQASYSSFDDFWIFRRQFAYQFAALTFMTYVMNMNNRFPHKMFIAKATGNIWGTELIPAMAASNAYFHNNEPVPFRLTPNLHTLMGPIAVEGIYSCAIMAIARCLMEPEFELEQYLSLFVRDEMIFWFTQQHRGAAADQKLREKVDVNSTIIVRRTAALCANNTAMIPANQTVIDLISKAVNPANLAQTDHLWMPYL
ncbi:hypothetical protein TWF696_003861 [Orbilia brochopaga]|uniref:Non-specific serine/threonine protein kinase n=1 Tax=Orbilia brochopaga TaxID=3140254 RepID=A0AAV9V708_9PEZI